MNQSFRRLRRPDDDLLARLLVGRAQAEQDLPGRLRFYRTRDGSATVSLPRELNPLVDTVVVPAGWSLAFPVAHLMIGHMGMNISTNDLEIWFPPAMGANEELQTWLEARLQDAGLSFLAGQNPQVFYTDTGLTVTYHWWGDIYLTGRVAFSALVELTGQLLNFGLVATDQARCAFGFMGSGDFPGPR